MQISYLKEFAVLLLFLFIGAKGVFAQNKEQKVTLDLKEATLKDFFDEVQKQTQYSFVYNSKDTVQMKPVTIKVKDKELEEVLSLVFKGSGFVYQIKGTIIGIKYVPETSEKPSASKKEIEYKNVSGVITDNKELPIPGVNIWLKGTNKGSISDESGMFQIRIPNDSAYFLQFSFMGMKTKEVEYKGQTLLLVTMEDDVAELSEIAVVGNGMFTRKTETFTGSAITYGGADLKAISNQNILVSLKNIDPAFNIIENVDFGSDPNRLPDIQMRGPTTLDVDLEGEYENSPNQPLFILNGFETTMEKVYDMDMNLVKSITLLKDAAAKAVYGSKAANGVVIIETVQPEQGKLRASYNGSIDITVPDLTSYNLTNAAEKLQAEVLAGKYTSNNAYDQAGLTEEYNVLYKEIARGVDTYWMAKPLRLGVGQKHSMYLDGGDDAMRYSANLSYNNIAGVMKGSSRTTTSGNVTLSYRFKKLLFRNDLTIDNNKAENSPYGSFSDYSFMNPYYRVYNESGNLIRGYNNSIYNPLYNAGLDSKDQSKYTLITENFYGEWNVADNLKLTSRFGYTQRHSESDVFKPASHTDYANISATSDEYLLRGQYDKTNGKSVDLLVNVGVAYSFHKNKHLLYTNLLYNLEESVSETSGMTAVGFPSDKMDYISFGSQYIDGGSPAGSESTTRSVGGIGSFNYSYDNKYLADGSFRLNGSSMFGAKERWGSFWSLGIGWNVHQEGFFKEISNINMFKLRASLGYTGSQNFNSYQAISTYSYITDRTYNGDMGVILLGLANDHLKWQQVYDRNIGADMAFFNNKLSARLDVYNSTTTSLLTDITLPPSMGFASYRENLGETENKGFELSLNYRVWSNPDNRSSLNLFFNVSHNTNKISKISDSLKELNEAQDAAKNEGGTSDEQVEAQQTPSIRFEEGQSMSAIWAVRSKGIDPVTGQEVFIKKDGSYTFDWSTADQVVCGDETPEFRGNFGGNYRYKGWDLNLSFSYKYGGQIYNSTLVNKVENVDVLNNNVDKRVLTDRWNTPGVPAKFKSITDNSVTKPTSRFVEDLNEVIFSSVNIAYDLSRAKWLKESPVEYLRIAFNMNDIGRLTTVKQEFGLSYPRARVFSFSVQTRF
ncbi:SusC/RagA family TonB-linked outer membrane protein [Plebeiibacterium marinum]|uniref:SusC/RagA family TonB-linked outer membrane protein n=1 Tax=Plebeiibacterium marinum TaxID=2992111 RepID=A0AAE3MFY5_9BACT|nr:SusC/RagA family TonB-linked outer membrane protein [Plebeiobacterium marinum]MCW3807133.1 SusC/RagA family TonB-linked outer membrane protein [Plebeiobacterium marinum]